MHQGHIAEHSGTTLHLQPSPLASLLQASQICHRAGNAGLVEFALSQLILLRRRGCRFLWLRVFCGSYRFVVAVVGFSTKKKKKSLSFVVAGLWSTWLQFFFSSGYRMGLLWLSIL